MRKIFWIFVFEFLGWCSIAQSKGDEKHILLLGGFKGEKDPQNKVFIYSKEDGRITNCLNYANNHIVEGSLGAIFMGIDEKDSYLVTCGGKGPDNAGKCFKLNKGKWERSSSMFRQYEKGGASIQLSHSKFIITGGYHIYHSNETPDADSEIFNGEKWGSGPHLPYGIAHHCALNINSNTTMIIGGEIETQVSPRTFIYDWNTETWSSGPELNIGRKFHSCGLHMGKVIITGGENQDEKALNVTEIFDPALYKIFFGPRLNQSITKAAMVSLSSNELYLIGGHSSQALNRIVPHQSILQYKDSGEWKEIGTLSEPMYQHTVHLVPESFWYQCESSASILIALNPFYIFIMKTFL